MIIAPKEEAVISASNVNVIEHGTTVWSSTGIYLVNDVVQVNGTTHKIFKAIKDGGQVISPALDVNVDGVGTYWFEVGATNYKRAFNELSTSKCVNTNTIYYKFSASHINLLYLSGLVAKSVQIVVTNLDTATVVFDETINTLNREVFDWFDWTYAQPTQTTELFKRLPLIYNASIEVTIDNTGSDAQVGHIVYGRSRSYGLSLIDPAPTSSMRSVTSKSRDEFGNIITRRKIRFRRMKINCLIDSHSIDFIQDRLNELADTACIFVGDEEDGGYRALLIYGELKDHDMPISVKKTKYQLEVEGYL